MTTKLQHLINVISRHLYLTAPTGTEFSIAMVDRIGDMELAHFDMTMADGAVIRVRVSDITPERVTP